MIVWLGEVSDFLFVEDTSSRCCVKSCLGFMISGKGRFELDVKTLTF